MHMHLDHGKIGNDQHAIADFFQTLAQSHHFAVLQIGARMRNDEFRTVTEGNFIQRFMIIHKFAGHRLNAGCARAVLQFDGFAGQRRIHAAQHYHQAHSAAVYHARLLQYRQHIGRALQNRIAAGDDHLKQLLHIVDAGSVLGNILRDYADYGQNRALLGLHHGFIRRVRRLAERLTQNGAVDILAARHALRQSAQNLAQNYAGIAARALQRTARHRIGNIRYAGQALGIHFLHRRCDRLRHI